MATEYTILDKVKENILGQASVGDFVLRERGAVDSAKVVENPHASLYAVDLQNQQGIFVQSDPAVDLCVEPFYYIAQYENATRVLTVPFADMIALGRKLPLNEERLVFIQSTGRAGSTLASQIFAQLDGVANISEPDALSDLVATQNSGLLDKADLAALTDATVRILANVRAEGGHVIKGRSYAMELGELFNELYPRARSVFLYRNLKSYTLSSLRAYDDGVQRSDEENQELLAGIRAWFSTLLPMIADVPEEQPLSAVDIIGLQWLSVMDRYVKLHEKGVEMLAIDYQSWIDAPRETAEAMLDYCNMLPDDLTAVYAALKQDSQEGTVLSRSEVRDHDTWLKTADLLELDDLLAQQPLINTADFVAPNTLGRQR